MRKLSSIQCIKKSFGGTNVPNKKINTTNTFEKKVQASYKIKFDKLKLKVLKITQHLFWDPRSQSIQ